jgi:hypothetical protein
MAAAAFGHVLGDTIVHTSLSARRSPMQNANLSVSSSAGITAAPSCRAIAGRPMSRPVLRSATIRQEPCPADDRPRHRVNRRSIRATGQKMAYIANGLSAESGPQDNRPISERTSPADGVCSASVDAFVSDSGTALSRANAEFTRSPVRPRVETARSPAAGATSSTSRFDLSPRTSETRGCAGDRP